VVAGCDSGQGRHLHGRSVAAAQACLECWRIEPEGAREQAKPGTADAHKFAHETRRKALGRTATGRDDAAASGLLEGPIEPRTTPASTPHG
jgi:hypothetical protein